MFKTIPKYLNEKNESFFLRKHFRKESFHRENNQNPALEYIKKNNTFITIKEYLQSKTTQNILYVLTFIWEWHTGWCKTAECSLKNLKLWQRDLPSSSIILNHLVGKQFKKYIIIEDVLNILEFKNLGKTY